MNGLHLIALAAPLAAPSPPADSAPEDAAFLRWVEDHAVPLEELDSDEGRALLDRLLRGKRLVLLGETDHFVQAKYDADRIFATELHRRGWRRVGMERGRSDGLRLDRYLETGREEELDRVGIFRSLASRGEGSVMRGPLLAEYQLARELRALGEGSERVLYFGYDVDMVPGGAYEDAAERLEPFGGEPAVADLLAGLADLAARPRSAQLEALPAVLEELAEPDSPAAAVLPAAVLDEVLEDLVMLRESLRFVLAPAQTVPLMQRREEAMFRSMDRLLARWPDDERVLLFGHNAHLSRDSSRFAMPRSPMWRSLGTHLAETYSGEVCAIWTLFDHGDHLAFHPRVPEPVESIEGTLEHVLAAAELDAYLFPIEGAALDYLDRERRFRHNAQPTHGNVSRQADAILFFKRTTVAGGPAPDADRARPSRDGRSRERRPGAHRGPRGPRRRSRRTDRVVRHFVAHLPRATAAPPSAR